jgi:hypothetical protein
MTNVSKDRPRSKSSSEDKLAVGAGVTALGCIGFLVLVKLAFFAAVIYGLVELGLFLTRH